jgi:hypothetical protein
MITSDVPTRIDLDAQADALSHRLGIKANDLARMLASYGRKSPPGEFADAVQAITLEWLTERPANARLANTIARTTIIDYWRKWRIRQHNGIESSLDGTTEIHQLQEALVAGVAWELQSDGALDCESITRRMPDRIRGIIQHRLDGRKLETADRTFLHRWIRSDGAATVHSMLVAA